MHYVLPTRHEDLSSPTPRIELYTYFIGRLILKLLTSREVLDLNSLVPTHRHAHKHCPLPVTKTRHATGETQRGSLFQPPSFLGSCPFPKLQSSRLSFLLPLTQGYMQTALITTSKINDCKCITADRPNGKDYHFYQS